MNKWRMYCCRDCKNYEITRLGSKKGVYGHCLLKNSRTDKGNHRQAGQYACKRFEELRKQP